MSTRGFGAPLANVGHCTYAGARRLNYCSN